MLKNIFRKRNQKELFWDWFSKNSEQFFHFERNQFFLFKMLKAELDKIDYNLVFEFGPINNESREFVISADGIKSSFSSVIDLTQAAPSLPKWKIIAFRQPKPVTDVFIYESIKINFDDIYFSHTIANHKMSIDLFFKEFSESSEWTSLTFLLIDYLIGEYDAETYISSVEKHLYNDNHDLKPISQLKTIISEHKKTVLN